MPSREGVEFSQVRGGRRAGCRCQMSQGHYATGTFDIVTSLAPFGLKGTRAATLGEGTRFGQMRGLGESASWSTRFGRFNQLDAAIRTTAGDAWHPMSPPPMPKSGSRAPTTSRLWESRFFKGRDSPFWPTLRRAKR